MVSGNYWHLLKKGEGVRDSCVYFRLLRTAATAAITIMITTAAVATYNAVSGPLAGGIDFSKRISQQ